MRDLPGLDWGTRNTRFTDDQLGGMGQGRHSKEGRDIPWTWDPI